MPIPRIIIQTHENSEIGQEFKRTWQDRNPDFDYRFFDREAREKFILENFPRLLETYQRLPLPVQKADLFRYAAIHRIGGVYSDVDSICRAPLDSYIDFDRDHLVAGVEMSPFRFGGDLDSYADHYPFPYQLMIGTFASPPQHPAILDLFSQIAFQVQRLSDQQLRAWSRNMIFTLQLTGNLLFTQVLNGHLSRGTKPPITIIRQMTWGYCPGRNRRDDSPNDPEIKVQHLFEGSWWRKNPDPPDPE